MASNFLLKFQGKITTVSKQGPDNLLKGSEAALIYTNTAKSFASSKIARSFDIRHGTEEFPKRQVTDITDEKRSLHLPALGQRYLAPQSKNVHTRLVQKGVSGHIDKQTDWFIEDNPRSGSSPQAKEAVPDLLACEKENKEKLQESKPKTVNRNNSFSKPNRAGGLGPNIGGQEWQRRHAKQQKALNYANNLRKIYRQKEKHKDEGSQFLFAFNGKNSSLQ